MQELISLKMYGEIKFNRNIIKTDDYISIGQFVIVDQDNKKIEFDFCDFAAKINDNDESKLDFICEEIDIESFPDVLSITPDILKNIKLIDEFNYYSENNNDDDLIIESIKDLKFDIFMSDTEEWETIAISNDILSNIKFNKCD